MNNDRYFRQLFERADNCPSRILILLQWIDSNKETASLQDIEDILKEENIYYSKSAISTTWKLLEKKGLVKINRHGGVRLRFWHEVKLTSKGRAASSSYRITHRFWKHR